jgi:hypothetical protein
MTNWMPTAAAILAAVGLGLSSMDDPTVKLIGQIMSVVGTALLGLVAKQYNVHGGTVAQATPAAVQEKMKEEGAELDCKNDPASCLDKK